jgi:hydrogenase nickel incorporation protein HypB
MVHSALDGWELRQLDFLFIENAGNLVCPSSYDPLEALRLVLLSVTEGQGKPLVVLTSFNSADAAIMTKSDLAAAVECNGTAARSNNPLVQPGMEVCKPSAKTGEGMSDYLEFLRQRRARSSAATAVLK